MVIQFPEDPLTSINTWYFQMKKHKQERGATEMEILGPPGTTKDSREKLHTVENATDCITDWRSFWADVLKEEKPSELCKAKEETIKGFLDTICCALEDMSGKEVFECFVEAVKNEFEYKTKESTKVTELYRLLSQSK